MLCVYILNSIKLDRFYIGFTSDFDSRLEFHRQAAQHKFTYNADDWTTFLTIECDCKTQGLAIEKHIKSMKSKVYINNLKIYPEMIEKLKTKYMGC
jgi:putative endonuclease